MKMGGGGGGGGGRKKEKMRRKTRTVETRTIFFSFQKQTDNAKGLITETFLSTFIYARAWPKST